MSSPNDTTPLPPPLDLSGWRKLPAVLMAGGAVLSVIGAVMNPTEFGFSWLLAFMFFLSIALGALFLVMVHHLSDAGWSVATRRVCEHIASLLFPWLALLFLPVAFFAKYIYSWMTMDPHGNNSLSAKWPVFTDARFLYYVGGFLRPLVAVVVPAALLVAPAGRNRRRALHVPDAFPFGMGDGDVRADAHLLRRALDASRSIPVVFGHLRRLLFRQLRVGRPGGGICHHRTPATPAHSRPRAAQPPVLFPGSAVLRVHGFPGLCRVRAILCRLEREHARRDLLVSSSAKMVRGGGWAWCSSSAISCCRSSCCCR